MTVTNISSISSLAAQLKESSIRTIANYGMSLPDVIPLWFGESDIPTPQCVSDAAIASLRRGETKYTPNNGIPALCAALSAYQSALYHQSFAPENIVVTLSGTDALMLAAQTCIQAGDKVVVITPVFPTLFAIPELLGAQVEQFPLTASGDHFELDLAGLFHVASDAKAIIINSPANPTGWYATESQIEQMVEFSRRSGVWIISDEVYARHFYEAKCAPSFCQYMNNTDRLIVCNSFSKAWSMTGWRLGWLTLPENLRGVITKLIEFNVSCAPGFIQAGGLAAVTQGEDFIAQTKARYHQAKQMVELALSDIPGVTLYATSATFYAFIKVDGLPDNSQPFILDMIETAKVGVAPGEAFGEAGKGHLRICYGMDLPILHQALERIRQYLLLNVK